LRIFLGCLLIDKTSDITTQEFMSWTENPPRLEDSGLRKLTCESSGDSRDWVGKEKSHLLSRVAGEREGESESRTHRDGHRKRQIHSK
jgi:hypothetical protein